MSDRPPEIIDAVVEPVTPPPKRRSAGFALGVALLVGAGLAAFAVTTWPKLLEPLGAVQRGAGDLERRVKSIEQALADAATTRAQLAEIDRRLKLVETTVATDPTAKLEARLGALEAKVDAQAQATGTAPPTDLKPVEDKLAAVDGQVDSLARRLATAEQAIKAQAAADQTPLMLERIQNLEDAAGRLATAQQTNRKALDGLAGVMVAVEPLRLALRRGAPFSDELATLQPFLPTPAPAEFVTLQALAAQGVPALTELQQKLPDTVRAVLRQAGQQAADTWWEKALARLQSLVIIRRTGQPIGDDPGAIVARAEAKAGQGDIAGAMAELSALPAGPAAAAKDWLALAERRVNGERALAGLEAALIARLAAAKP